MSFGLEVGLNDQDDSKTRGGGTDNNYYFFGAEFLNELSIDGFLQFDRVCKEFRIGSMTWGLFR